MSKQTLEAALLARRDDSRALRGTLIFVNDKPRIVFGALGDHRRFSVDVVGDVFTLSDDPRDPDSEPETGTGTGRPEGPNTGGTTDSTKSRKK